MIEKIIVKNKLVKSPKSRIFQLINRNKGYGIYHLVIDKGSFLINQSLLESGLKERYNILVLNIDKGESLINLPDANYIIEQGDDMLIYGKSDSIRDLVKNLKPD